MEKFSIEKAHDKALKIQEKAINSIDIKGSNLSRSDYEKSEKEIARVELINELKEFSPYGYATFENVHFHPELLSDPEIKSVLADRISRELKSSTLKGINTLVKHFAYVKDIFNSSEHRELLLKKIIHELSDSTSSLKIEPLICAINFNIQASEILTKEAQTNIARYIRTELDFNRTNDIVNLENIIKRLSPSANDLLIIYSNLVYYGITYAVEFAKKFNLPTDTSNEIVYRNLADLLDRGQYDEEFSKFKNNLGLSDEKFESICREGIIKSFEKGDVQGALRMLEDLHLPKEIINSDELGTVANNATKKYLIKYLPGMSHHVIGIYDKLAKFDNIFQLTDEEYCDIISEVLQEHDNFSSILEMHKVLTFSEKIIQNHELKSIIADKILSSLKVTQLDEIPESIADIKKLFKISYKNTDIYKKFPGIEKIVNSINEINPNIVKFLETEDCLLRLVKYENSADKFIIDIKNNPFLLEAFINNQQYGHKLLLKFPEFDSIAKQNIATLYNNKEEILNGHPDVDPSSSEFRILMQQRLAKFAKNEEILAEIIKRGVDIKQWLKYSEEQHFDLGVEDDVSFSEQIQSPIKRIDQSIGNYINQIVTTLGQYKKDLILKESVSDKKPELEAKLAKMQEQLIESERSGDEAKRQGVQKGIISLEKQIAQLKPDNLWNKISGEIDRLKSSTEHLSKLFQELCSSEEGLKTIGDDKKLQVAQKDKIKKQEQKIKEKIIDFDKSLSGFQDNFNSILKQAFSVDRADAISQEITMSIGEDFDHYRTDLSTIQSLFKEDSSSLEKTPMRIGIAPRNPDVDLYLGNYAPCCICIDSEYHGEQSPIADYVTDLGMHNVVVYDEQRKKPVAVAWCFIGKNNNNNEPILVIDNIEANTDYSIKFKSQLEKELGEYITKLAKASKISKIIQGQLNNDLEVAELSEIDQKLGGTNRATGYYLEAERDVDENDTEDWEEDYYKYENDDMPTEHADELQQENVEQDEKYSEYENERGDFLRSNRARRTLREDK